MDVGGLRRHEVAAGKQTALNPLPPVLSLAPGRPSAEPGGTTSLTLAHGGGK